MMNMKATLRLAGLVWACTLVTSVAFGQQYQSIVKMNPFGLFTGQYMIGYEHMLNDQMSVQLMPGFISSSGDQNSSLGAYNNRLERSKTGFIVIPEFRYYVSPDATGAPHGLYLAAFVRYLSAKWDWNDVRDEGYTYYDDVTGTTLEGSADVSRDDQRDVIGGGITIGYAYYTSGGAMVEAFIGPQFKSVSFTRNYLSEDISSVEQGDVYFGQKYIDTSLGGSENTGMGLRFGVNIGFGF